MRNLIAPIIKKYTDADLISRLRQHVVGFAQDLWNDGPEDPFRAMPALFKKGRSGPATFEPTPVSASRWHALPGEIAEKMWGEGDVVPKTETISRELIKSLGLAADMRVLDLSAGLGYCSRLIAETYDVHVTSMEPDASIAKRGMGQSLKSTRGKMAPILSYDAENFSSTDTYDCIVARELFYRVADKAKFLSALSECANPTAQISFTDYIVNPEDSDRAAIKAWRAYEADASPLSLIGMAEAWAKVGFTINFHEDQTELYRKEIPAGLKRLAAFLSSSLPPDAATKRTLLASIQTWTHRMAALQNGMKFYRFYGVKQ